MLKVVVQPSVKKLKSGEGIFKKVKIHAPNTAKGTDPKRIIKGSRKELNCAASTKKTTMIAKAKVRRNLLLPPLYEVV